MSKVRIEHLPADTLGLSEIARAGLAQGMDFPFVPVVRSAKDVPEPEDRFDRGERLHLADRLRRGLEAYEPPANVAASLSALETPGTCAVITGQQPGLLVSPLYTLYKAIQACRLAFELRRRFGRPVVPMFWNHADDHDVAEVHHAWLLNANLDLQRVGLAGMSSGRMPLSRLPLSDETHRLGAIEQALLQIYGDRPHKEEAIELYMPREGESLPNATTRVLTELLGPSGLVVIEPDWIRPDLSHAMGGIVSRDPLTHLREAETQLRAAGLPVTIESETAALVYRVDEKGRHALRRGGEGFQYDGEAGSRTYSELASEVVGDPPGFSPGALLRPVVQDMSLPIAAVIGGYGELAYHAQLGPLRDANDLPRTPFVPRVGATIVDPPTQQSLARLDIHAREVLEARGQFDTEVDQNQLPEVLSDMRAVTETYAKSLLALREELAVLDKGLAVNLKRSADQARTTIGKLITKGERVFANSSGKGKRHVRRVNHSLFPRGAPQDRVLGPFAWHAQHGRAFLDALIGDFPAAGSEHILVYVEETEDTPS